MLAVSGKDVASSCAAASHKDEPSCAGDDPSCDDLTNAMAETKDVSSKSVRVVNVDDTHVDSCNRMWYSQVISQPIAKRYCKTCM